MQLIKKAFCKTNYWTWRVLLQVQYFRQTKQTTNKSRNSLFSMHSDKFRKSYIILKPIDSSYSLWNHGIKNQTTYNFHEITAQNNYFCSVGKKKTPPKLCAKLQFIVMFCGHSRLNVK